MSTENTTLTDFQTAEPDEDTSDKRPSWAPNNNTSTGHACHNCGEPVSAETERVWGDNQNQLHHCPECVTATDMKAGAGVNPNFENRQDGENEEIGEALSDGDHNVPDYMLAGLNGGES